MVLKKWEKNPLVGANGTKRPPKLAVLPPHSFRRCSYTSCTAHQALRLAVPEDRRVTKCCCLFPKATENMVKIYKLKNNQKKHKVECFVSSTCKPKLQRQRQQRQQTNNQKNNKSNITWSSLCLQHRKTNPKKQQI